MALVVVLPPKGLLFFFWLSMSNSLTAFDVFCDPVQCFGTQFREAVRLSENREINLARY